MSIIKFYQDLKVFQKSVDVAMIIFELSKSFPKEDLQGQFLQISVKLGEKENMKSLL